MDLSKGKRCIDLADSEIDYERPSKLRCSYRGVDIRHLQTKSGVWELVVQARFVKLKGGSIAVRKAQAMFLNNAVVSDVESEDLEVSIGDYLRIGVEPNLNTYVVESIDAKGIVCCRDATDDHEQPIYMTLKEANYQYNKYTRY